MGKEVTPDILANEIASILDSKKALNIEILDVKAMTIVTEYFVICSGTSTTQVRSLAEITEEKIEDKFKIMPTRKEGLDGNRWIVLDYGFVIVHIFHETERQYYNLERLWKEERRPASVK